MINEEWKKEARNFFESRKKQLKEKEYQISKMDDPPYVHFCLMPLGQSTDISFDSTFLNHIKGLFAPCDYQKCLEGHMFYYSRSLAIKLLIINPNGGFEIVFCKQMLESPPLYIHEQNIEIDIVTFCEGIFKLYKNSPPHPCGIFYHLSGVKGKKIWISNQEEQDSILKTKNIKIEFPRDEISNERFVEQELTSEKDISKELKPLFDPIWSVVGYDQSLNYDDAGEWKGNSNSVQ